MKVELKFTRMETLWLKDIAKMNKLTLAQVIERVTRIGMEMISDPYCKDEKHR